MRTLGILIALTLAPLAACLDQPPGPPQQITVGDSNVEIPDELRLDPEGTPTTPLAHSNCGHMAYCNRGGRAIYCFYNQATTGCSLQDIVNDYNSDCQYVCGHTLCLNSTIQSCSSL